MTRGAAWLVALCLLSAASCRGGFSSPDPSVPPTAEVRLGRELLATYGCGACHTVPGVRGARGTVGPPLHFFSRRAFIAGAVPNNTENLARWIVSPQSIEPGTAMPTLGVAEPHARAMAAYLFTLR